MSVQPPGYNPSDSLLQGGSATITPLMGGGGFIEGTPDQSLLHGGNSANIIPLKGGRRLEKKRRSRKQKQCGGADIVPSYTAIAEVVHEIPRESEIDILEKKMLEARDAAMASAPVTVFEPEPVKPPPEPTLANTMKKARDDAITAMRVQQAKENIAAFSPQKTAAYATVAEIVQGLPKPMSGGGDNQEVKIDKAPLDQIMKEKGTKLPTITDGLFKEFIREYKKFILPKWKRFNVLNKTETEISKLYTSNNCKPFTPSLDDKNTFGGLNFDRLVYIIPPTVNRILLFPPVNGSTTTFLRCLNFLNTKNKSENPNPNLVVIFAPPFFGNDIEKNKQIYAHFLKIKLEQEEKKGAKIFLLTQDTTKNISAGCQLNPGDEYILNMLEPSYIVLPYKRTIENQEVGGIIFSGAAADEESVPASRDDRNASISSFLIYSLRNNWFAFPPRINLNDTNLNKIIPYKVYRFIGNNKTNELNDSTRLYFRLTTEDKGAKKEAEILGIFYPTHPTQLVLDNINYELIQLGGETYSIRKPKLNTDTQPKSLIDDWFNGKFTEDEAKMLNDLNFRQEYLEEIFESNWRTELSEFLLNLVMHKCYSDTKLLTGANCDIANDFINRVFEFFLENDTRIARMHQQENEIYLDTALTYAKQADKLRSQTDKSSENLFEKLEEQVGITREEIPKLGNSPFTDGQLERLNDITPISPIIMYSQQRGEFARGIYANDIGGKNYKSMIYVKASNEIEASKLIEQKIKKLRGTYPGWEFFDVN